MSDSSERTKAGRHTAGSLLVSLDIGPAGVLNGPATLGFVDVGEQAVRVVEISPAAATHTNTSGTHSGVYVRAAHSYLDLARLSERCDALLGASTLDKHADFFVEVFTDPPTEVAEEVRQYVEKFGLLLLGLRGDAVSHSCDALERGDEPGPLAEDATIPTAERPYLTTVRSFLWEARQLRKAAMLWDGWREFIRTGSASVLAKTMRMLGFNNSGQRHNFVIVRGLMVLQLMIQDHLGPTDHPVTVETTFRIPGEIPSPRARRPEVEARQREQLKDTVFGWRLNARYPLASYWLDLYEVLQNAASTCKFCGRPFYPKRKDQEFCEPKHGDSYRKRLARSNRPVGPVPATV
jgi:hypothetical protein